MAKEGCIQWKSDVNWSWRDSPLLVWVWFPDRKELGMNLIYCYLMDQNFIEPEEYIQQIPLEV